MTSAGSLASTDRALCDVHDAILLDLDGVVYVGDHAVPGAVEALNSLTIPMSFLTNNATRTAADVADHLRSFGLRLEDDAVVTAGQVVSAQIAADLGRGARVLLAGADGMRRALEADGHVVVTSMDEAPIAVVQGGVVDVRWSELAEASYAIAAGLPWYASNPDLTFPTPRGLAPGNGAMVQAVQLATGATPVVAGKPARMIYDQARERMGSPARPLMVGDRLDTDIDGAIAAGVSSLVVLTGVNDLADVFAADSGHRPDYIAADMAALAVAHPPVQVDGTSAVCGGVTAEVRGGVIEVDGTSTDFCSLRAAVELAWSIRDASGENVGVGGTLVS